MSSARLSSLSFQTLSLVLERQRLQKLGKPPPAASLITVKKNLEILREGIIELEAGQAGKSAASFSSNAATPAPHQATAQLRAQWERAKKMLGDDGDGIGELVQYLISNATLF
jgi:syntaxin 8